MRPEARTDLDPCERLRALRDTVAALFSAREEILPTGGEAQRLSALRAALLHLCSLRCVGAVKAEDDARYLRAAAIRDQAGEVLRLLGDHAGRELPAALTRAAERWDQAGEVSLLSPEGRAAALELHRSAISLLDEVLAAEHGGPAVGTLFMAAAEAMLAVDAACSLLRAFEVRFVVLLRERLRLAPEGADARAQLLPAGVPFLDVGATLRAVARALSQSAGAST